MSVSQVSLQAFEKAKLTLAHNQAKVLWSIHNLNIDKIPCSDRQIANLLGWEINRVIPRRRELEKANRIYSIGIGYDGLSSIKVNLWAIRGSL